MVITGKIGTETRYTRWNKNGMGISMERDGSGQVGLTIISAFLGDRRSWRAAVGAPPPLPLSHTVWRWYRIICRIWLYHPQFSLVI